MRALTTDEETYFAVYDVGPRGDYTLAEAQEKDAVESSTKSTYREFALVDAPAALIDRVDQICPAYWDLQDELRRLFEARIEEAVSV